ncbi:Uncharacterised protein [Amycolatopsis camponoti]|uniref:Uncharacterized protein n=1 Tax=Amycolatopsis camponoti TaxID=2606593 RepID=A0A6I8LP72_9PSEU|nr:Uncharacterised protein [Amycolatopsis camponoti]
MRWREASTGPGSFFEGLRPGDRGAAGGPGSLGLISRDRRRDSRVWRRISRG